jgi:hypothetical protein
MYKNLLKAFKDKIPGGLADKKQPSDFESKALNEGIKVEKEHTSDPDIAREIAMDHLTEDKKYYNKLKIIEDKKLDKGAMQRLAPFKPQDVKSKDHDLMQEWQTAQGSKDRDTLSSKGMEPNALKRALHKLSGTVPTRKAKDGGREFLLHRGMSRDEFNSYHSKALSNDKHIINHDSASSWSANKRVADKFKKIYSKNPQTDEEQRGRAGVASAWVHEKNIRFVPNQYGHQNQGMDLDDNPEHRGGINKYADEQEIIVAPDHASELVNKKQVKQLTGNQSSNIDQLITTRSQAQPQTEYALGGKAPVKGWARMNNQKVLEDAKNFAQKRKVVKSDPFGMVGQSQMAKSNYGKFKGGSQYNVADNVRRKQQNVGTQQEVGIQGIKVKSGTGAKLEQGKAKFSREMRQLESKNKKQPVTKPKLSPEEAAKYVAQANLKQGLKKGAQGDWKKEGYTIKHQPHPDESFVRMVAYAPNGEKAGYAEFVHHNDKYIKPYDEGAKFEDAHPSVSIGLNHRRKGLASAMYMQAERITGKKIRKLHANRRTEAGQALWNQPQRTFGIKKSENIKSESSSTPHLKFPHLSRTPEHADHPKHLPAFKRGDKVSLHQGVIGAPPSKEEYIVHNKAATGHKRWVSQEGHPQSSGHYHSPDKMVLEEPIENQIKKSELFKGAKKELWDNPYKNVDAGERIKLKPKPTHSMDPLSQKISPKAPSKKWTDKASLYINKQNMKKKESTIKLPRYNPQVRNLADSYMASKGQAIVHSKTPTKVNPARASKIAQAFHEMKHDPNEPETKAAYKALTDETMDQFQHIKKTGLKISPIEPGMQNPYKMGSRDLAEDVRKNNHIWYYPTEQGFGPSQKMSGEHPLLQPTNEKAGNRQLLANDVFRIVHDYFGHAKEGHSFGPQGEENAWRDHMDMYSPPAQRALTSETRGQNSWVNFGPYSAHNKNNPHQTKYAEQKVGLLPTWAMDTK